MMKLGKKLGIIGGGQLAQMLAIEGQQMGLEVHVLSEKNTDPAALVTAFWHEGLPGASKDQTDFAKKVDFLTFESEFFQMENFKEIQKNLPVQIFPSPQVMEKIQNRSSQKKLIQHYKLPTANFIHVQIFSDLQTAAKKFKNQFVLKKSMGGYDGYGTYYCRQESDLEKLKSLLPGDFIAEELISFQKEMAIIFVRSQDGSIVHLPLVESQQTQSRCDWVCGPHKHPKLKSLIVKVKKMLSKENYVGTMGIEFFCTKKELLINEIAPRVHNTGHYSQQAFLHSQFSLHLQAGLGMKLYEPQLLAKAFVMTNLIGQGNEQMQIPTNLIGKLHWYGKKDNRVGRKLGHVNYLGTNPEQLLKLAIKERKGFQL